MVVTPAVDHGDVLAEIAAKTLATGGSVSRQKWSGWWPWTTVDLRGSTVFWVDVPRATALDWRIV